MASNSEFVIFDASKSFQYFLIAILLCIDEPDIIDGIIAVLFWVSKL